VSPGLARRALAEGLGTALLVAAVIGSGIAAARLSPGDVGLELLENAVATGAALVALILAPTQRSRWPGHRPTPSPVETAAQEA
jgi:arsenate reductase